MVWAGSTLARAGSARDLPRLGPRAAVTVAYRWTGTPLQLSPPLACRSVGEGCRDRDRDGARRGRAAGSRRTAEVRPVPGWVRSMSSRMGAPRTVSPAQRRALFQKEGRGAVL